MLAVFGLTVIVVRAQTFSKPTTPAPDNTGLNTFSGGTSDFVDLTATVAHTIQSSLAVASTTQASAFLGDTINNIGITGVAGVSGIHPAIPNNPGTAVYGYAQGNSSRVGVYARGTGFGSIGMVGKTSSGSGFAGKFYGPVQIVDKDATNGGNLYAQGTVSAMRINAYSADAGIPAVYSGNGTVISTKGRSALRGDSFYNVGIYGYSTARFGMRIVNIISPGSLFGGNGALGYYVWSDGSGVYGWSAKGNGVEARVGSPSILPAAYGDIFAPADPRSNDASAALYARGDAFAGYFEGDVAVLSGKTLYLNKTAIDETALQALLTWCNNAAVGGGDFCPD